MARTRRMEVADEENDGGDGKSEVSIARVFN